MMTEEQRRFEQWASGIYDTRLLKDEKGNYLGQVLQQLWQAWQAALTQPANPALKLPEKSSRGDADVVDVGFINGCNACLDEFKRLNAPHAAPIEPICATGGAEWVKVSERMPRHRQSVLGWQEKPGTVIECYPEGIKWYYDYSDGPCGNITHWMPLPAEPEEE